METEVRAREAGFDRIDRSIFLSGGAFLKLVANSKRIYVDPAATYAFTIYLVLGTAGRFRVCAIAPSSNRQKYHSWCLFIFISPTSCRRKQMLFRAIIWYCIYLSLWVFILFIRAKRLFFPFFPFRPGLLFFPNLPCLV